MHSYLNIFGFDPGTNICLNEWKIAENHNETNVILKCELNNMLRFQFLRSFLRKGEGNFCALWLQSLYRRVWRWLFLVVWLTSFSYFIYPTPFLSFWFPPMSLTGFHTHLSDQDFVLNLFSDIEFLRIHKRHVSIVFLDIDKAFDSVCVESLLEWLADIRLRRRITQYLKNYFSHRSFTV